MTDHVTKAISAALDDHAKAERHIDRWNASLMASIHNGILEHISAKMFVSEGMRIRAATLAQELANDFTDNILPAHLSKLAGGATIERTAYASALNQGFLEGIAAKFINAAIRALDPQIRKHLDEQDRRFASQPSASYVEPKIDLGAYAADQAKRFAIEDARKAAPAPLRGEFVEPNEQALGEATLSQAYPAHEKGPAPSAARVKEALAKSDTAIDMAPGGGKYPAKRRR